MEPMGRGEERPEPVQRRGLPGVRVAGQPGNKWDGCTTKNFFGLALAFTPTWFQVFPAWISRRRSRSRPA